MRALHSVLRRQLSRHLGDPESLPQEWKAFLEVVNEAYHQADEDRKLLERTMDLSSQEMMKTNAELSRTKDEAQSASRAKSEFLSGMSHELRTPLNAIIGFSELLLEEVAGPVAPLQKEYVGHVVEAGRHLLSLINDILDLSKIEAGRVELRREHSDWPQLVQVRCPPTCRPFPWIRCE